MLLWPLITGDKEMFSIEMRIIEVMDLDYIEEWVLDELPKGWRLSSNNLIMIVRCNFSDTTSLHKPQNGSLLTIKIDISEIITTRTHPALYYYVAGQR